MYHIEYFCWIISRILKWLVHKCCMCTCMSLDPGCHLCGYCGIMEMVFDWFGDWTLFEQMSIFMTRSVQSWLLFQNVLWQYMIRLWRQTFNGRCFIDFFFFRNCEGVLNFPLCCSEISIQILYQKEVRFPFHWFYEINWDLLSLVCRIHWNGFLMSAYLNLKEFHNDWIWLI